MKKVLLASGLIVAAPFASADFLGVYAGAGQWQSDYSGQLGDADNDIGVNELGLKESDNNYVYVAFEHPVPLIPNGRIQYTDLSSQQSATVTDTFTLDGETFVPGDVESDVDLTHIDYTLYYELLDNWVNLDLGLTFRQFDGHVYAEGTANGLINEQNVTLDETLPMAYGKAQFDLPLTGFSVGAQGNVVNYDDDSLTDLSVNVSYNFVDSVLDLGVELGYRQMNLEINEDVTADVELKGPYAAVNLHF
ncbi:TIGR04219 family outer membrane beta-barrel protein [Marinimicrobium locisalis]|uniref:TIGR04219 family outer membrane beta-barrel protein n=1 Tax=Marinimicrobium locisalis TaxID=546022 RepID=UPI003222062E